MSDIFQDILEKHKEGLKEVSKFAWDQGKKFERERILKLLDANLGNKDWSDIVKLIEGQE
jgi:hypothetical protein